jgi:Ser/Thr protein kinase RdoA (MazF antagonist)
MTDREVPLTGGRVTAGVVRVGDTVRRPPTRNSPFVRQLLAHFEAAGVSCVPRFLGIDALGRDSLSFLHGEVPSELGMFSAAQLAAAASLLRRIHDATATCVLRGNHEIVVHGDASPCNYVFVEGMPVGLIDFDAARPGLRREDVGYAAWLWLNVGDRRLAVDFQLQRLKQFVGAYGAFDPDDAVPAVLDIQKEFANRPDAPEKVRAWARDCFEWAQALLR